MALNTDTLRSRLREVFGNDPQDVVARKLNLTQGTISKILSGNQQPTLETVYHVAATYKVSVDWLLGLSEKKRITRYNGETTYASAVEAIGDTVRKGATIINEKKDAEAILHICDPLLRMLLRKNIALADMDEDLQQDWLCKKLSLFDDKVLLYADNWENLDVTLVAAGAVSEFDWIKTYNYAVKKTQEYDEMIVDYELPFNR